MKPFKVPAGYKRMTEFQAGREEAPWGRIIWRCSGCGTTSVWEKDWTWFGSWLAWDEGYVQNVFCPACVPVGAVIADRLPAAQVPPTNVLPDLVIKVRRRHRGAVERRAAQDEALDDLMRSAGVIA